jgi:hypothetical protein
MTIVFVTIAHAQAVPIGQESEIRQLSTGESFGKLAPRAVQQQSLEFIIPQLILGGEWTSTIRLTNRSTSTVPTTNVFFLDNLGKLMNATFQATNGNVLTDSGFSFSLAPGGIVEATFFGNATSQFGHAVIDICSGRAVCSSAGLYGEVALRNRNPTRPDFESVFPLEQPSDLQYMLWDHRNGLTSVLYLVNSNTSPTSVSLEFLNPANQRVGIVTVTLQSLESQILTPHALVPATIGLQGTLVIRGQSDTGFPAITASALRINPSNSFTPMRSFVPSR